MNNEILPLIRELCYIANERNKLNAERHRARYRKNYYSKMLRVVEAYKQSNYQLRKLNPDNVNTKRLRDMILLEMASIRKHNPEPKKWLALGSIKLRSTILKAESDLANAKHQLMELSLKTTKRVRSITAIVDGNLGYRNGTVELIHINTGPNSITRINKETIVQLAKEYELDKAVQNMVEG